jgi:hypothetical protein
MTDASQGGGLYLGLLLLHPSPHLLLFEQATGFALRTPSEQPTCVCSRCRQFLFFGDDLEVAHDAGQDRRLESELVFECDDLLLVSEEKLHCEFVCESEGYIVSAFDVPFI